MHDSVNVVKKVQSQEGGGQGDLKEPQGFNEEVGFWLYFMGKSNFLFVFFYLNTSRGKNVFMHVWVSCQNSAAMKLIFMCTFQV